MAYEVAQRHQDELKSIVERIEQSYEYFKPNYQRWHEFNKFIFLTTLTDDDISLLKTLLKPQIEFNILESYISRLRGEFSKQEPSIEVMPDYDMPPNPETVKAVEGYVRHMICDANKNGCEYRVYSDMLAGGFSVMKIWTEYSNEMSFDQVIKLGRAHDPCMCGFDPAAKESHKGDGMDCFEIFTKSEEEFRAEHPGIDISMFKYSKNEIGGFNWSYKTMKENIILVVDYYKKKTKKTKIYKLANGKSMTAKEYDEFLVRWHQLGKIEQPPTIVKERFTDIEIICRYRLIEDRILEYTETNFKMFPLIFCDGNSAFVRDSVNGALQQHTRPYVYHAKGVQRLKNYAGQCLANELENMVQHKWIISKEAIPDGQEEAYTNNQMPNVLTYNQFKDNDPNQRLDAPREVNRIPTPPEVINTFQLADQVTQTILGSYDASLGINNNQLSGIAIQEGATQSNAAAMPYIVGFLDALNRVAQIIVDLIPKYYVTPRTLPITSLDGKKSYIEINRPNGTMLNYDANTLNVKVEAGVNFSIQKSRALQQIIGLMQASPLFAQFMNTEGLEVLLDNLEIRGVDQLKVMVAGWMQQQKQVQQMAMQQAQNNPQMINAQTQQQKVQLEAQQNETKNHLDMASIAIEKQKADNDRMKLMLEAHEQEQQRVVQRERMDVERAGQAVDVAMKVTDLSHRHVKEAHELGHKIAMDHLQTKMDQDNAKAE